MTFRDWLLGSFLLLTACSSGGDARPTDGLGASGTGATGTAGSGIGAGPSGSAGASAGSGQAGGASAGATSGGASAGGADGQAGGAGGSAESAGGSAGSAGSAGGPPVDLPAGVADLFPLPGAKQVCADAPLKLTFSSAPQLGSSGKVRVFEVAAPAQPVAEVDFATMSISDTYGGQTFSLPRQVYVDGNDVVVLLKNKALGYGKQYYVTVDSGAIKPGGAAFSITDAMAWRFSTLASAATGSQLKVALDGSGQFCSWQGALDAVPANNTEPVTISIGNGNYHGIVYVSGKQNITLSGQDRKKTVFSGTNNNNLNPSTKTRAVVGGDNTSGLVVQNVTIRNLTPQGGSQAEALRLQGCDKCQVLSSDIVSLQDTLLWSGRIYAKDCYIAGNVDFVWGTGAVYFDQCEIKTTGRSGYVVQARNGAGAYGYVFVDSKITADAGITGSTLARIDVSAYPDSHVAFINCTLGSHISEAGWTVTGGAAPSSLRFWEYQSKDLNGNAVNVSGRVGGVQASAQQAAQMRDPSVVLGGWKP